VSISALIVVLAQIELLFPLDKPMQQMKALPVAGLLLLVAIALHGFVELFSAPSLCRRETWHSIVVAFRGRIEFVVPWTNGCNTGKTGETSFTSLVTTIRTVEPVMHGRGEAT
jgi:hypothetical protein